jgi:hypothetical protein
MAIYVMLNVPKGNILYELLNAQHYIQATAVHVCGCWLCIGKGQNVRWA